MLQVRELYSATEMILRARSLTCPTDVDVEEDLKSVVVRVKKKTI